MPFSFTGFSNLTLIAMIALLMAARLISAIRNRYIR
jgi:hypothetical protein